MKIAYSRPILGTAFFLVATFLTTHTWAQSKISIGGPFGVEFGDGRGLRIGGPDGFHVGGGHGARFGGQNGIQIGGHMFRLNSPDYGDKTRPPGHNQFGQPHRANGYHWPQATPVDVSKWQPDMRQAHNASNRISIHHPEHANESVQIEINGRKTEILPGETFELAGDRPAEIRMITNNRVVVRRTLSAGRYEFRSTARGWTLFPAKAAKPAAPAPPNDPEMPNLHSVLVPSLSTKDSKPTSENLPTLRAPGANNK